MGNDSDAAALWRCQYSAWSDALKDHILPARCIPLPDAFVKFLLSDGVYVGDENRVIAQARRGSADFETDFGVRAKAFRCNVQLQNEGEESSTSSTSDGESETESKFRDWFDDFPDLKVAIETAIKDLGGSAAPKTNWSAPIDATWVTLTGNIQCTNADEVAILLKSSDRIAHDLSEAGPSLSRELAVAVGGGGVTGGGEETEEAEAGARDGGHVGDRTGSVPAPSPSETHLSDVLSDNSFHPVLVLKKWVEIPPESEWRCFVRNGLLVGISQRDVTRVFPEIEARARVVRTALIRFHKHFVQPALARAGLERCVYDLYLDGRGRPFVLDVNTWGGATSPLLFEWKELEVAGEIAEEGSGGKGESDDPITHEPVKAGRSAVRVISDSADTVRAGPKTIFGMPYDFADPSLRGNMEEMIMKMQRGEVG